MRFLYGRLFAVACAAVALAMTACPKADDAILIGEVGSMTGAEATFGQSTDKGIRLAIDEINAAGGVKGKKLRVKLIDDQGKPEDAAGAVKALIGRDKIVALLGEVATSNSLAMAPEAQRAHVPMISPSSTGISLTQKGDYIFRVCFIDPFQGQVMAKFAKNTLPATKVAVLRDTASAYSVGLADSFAKAFTGIGGQVLLDEAYQKGQVDFRSQLTKIKAVSPDAIFVPGYYNDVGLIAKQARELGISAPLLGGDGWDSPKLFEIGGAAIEGSFYSDHYSVEDPGRRVRAFVEAFQKKFAGEKPDAMSALSYDATKILAAAMRQAPDLSGPALRDAIAATKGYEGITGVITLDGNRNAVKPAAVLKVKGGKSEFVTWVAP
jgi:branched-chain amino acid transport system substrate-binding protein